MASTAEFNQSLSSKGDNLRAWTLTLEAADTGPATFNHGMPFTPTVILLRPVSGIGTAYPGIGIDVTATTCTVTKTNAANTAGVYTLYLGRSPLPQNEG